MKRIRSTAAALGLVLALTACQAGGTEPVSKQEAAAYRLVRAGRKLPYNGRWITGSVA
ncbi:hypothetical protein [Streptosporangium canum]|uniref:hypothetical protein n=1 Tax=Streptosporangium canum TaxID=324952 RepID=UPI00378F149B